jgi:hypothetical protein
MFISSAGKECEIFEEVLLEENLATDDADYTELTM